MCALRSNARASGPRGYATTSSVLAIVLVAGSFDRFVNSARRLTSGGRLKQRGRGAMTPQGLRFIAEQQPATPCLVLDPDRVEGKLPRHPARVPLARIYYAVKANPARPGAGTPGGTHQPLRRRQLRGGRRLPRTPARGPKRSATATPSRRPRRSAAHMPTGVTLYALNSAEELEKLAAERPRRPGLLPHPGRQRRRGLALVAQVRHQRRERPGVMLRAGELGLDPYGLSFHVGSQQTTTARYESRSARSPCCSPT